MDIYQLEESKERNLHYNMTIADFIKEAHVLHDEEVNQKYDDHPYSYHLDMVIGFAAKFFDYVKQNDNDIVPVLFAAAFHDSIEDARLTYNDVLKIAKKYMKDEDALMATEIVYALTNEKGRTRAERANDKYYEGIRNTKYAPFVKMCDRIANMSYSSMTKSSMFNKYHQELPHFVESIKVDGMLPEIMISYAYNIV